MAATWAETAGRLSRNEYPEALAVAALQDETLTEVTEVAAGIEQAWTTAEWPARALSVQLWLYLFERVIDNGEYLRDAQVRPLTDLPELLTLYRGATQQHAVGMSWTDDLDRARWFAGRFNDVGGSTGVVWTVTVPRELVLARFDGRGEREYVLDVTMFGEDEVTSFGG
ncbi:hypothetical protein [Curtobacterium sp. MCBD17_040]|uniref:hypothetical protein n=1 Tax=Curtobacterium sp. MCBD17_040 TaxID=2175674 RepID=UPI000DA8AA56|nr:hypothetical protein [Curtobacterium sp. MCBD17_040]WIB65891.1 hypothetical protein DEI94_17400 [Curtobacterium sp. MCBD17_040]